MMTARFEKRDLKRLFLYLDVAMVGVFCIALALLVRDAYIAGFFEQRDLAAHNLNFWYMLRDAVFVVGALAWFFFRYFRLQIDVYQNPWV